MIDVSNIVLFNPRAPSRLDLAIAASGHDISRREARRLLDARRILVNGKPVATASRTVMPRDVIVVARVEVGIPILRRPSGGRSDRANPAGRRLLVSRPGVGTSSSYRKSSVASS